jgi:hypothetical protein
MQGCWFASSTRPKNGMSLRVIELLRYVRTMMTTIRIKLTNSRCRAMHIHICGNNITENRSKTGSRVTCGLDRLPRFSRYIVHKAGTGWSFVYLVRVVFTEIHFDSQRLPNNFARSYSHITNPLQLLPSWCPVSAHDPTPLPLALPLTANWGLSHNEPPVRTSQPNKGLHRYTLAFVPYIHSINQSPALLFRSLARAT